MQPLLMTQHVFRHKNEITNAFIEFASVIENLLESKIKTIRTDNAKELTEGNFRNEVESRHILREFSAPHTPEQNGVAERINRTLNDKMRTMLAASGLGENFWFDALRTAVFLYNRLPHSSLDFLSPFEQAFKIKPTLSHVRIFGSPAYVIIPKNERSKLSSRAKNMILIGFKADTKDAYILYNPITKREVISRRKLHYPTLATLISRSERPIHTGKRHHTKRH